MSFRVRLALTALTFLAAPGSQLGLALHPVPVSGSAIVAQPAIEESVPRPVWRRGDRAEYTTLTTLGTGTVGNIIWRYRKQWILLWRGRLADPAPLPIRNDVYLAQILLLPPDDDVFIVPGIGVVNSALPPQRYMRHYRMAELYQPWYHMAAQVAMDRTTGPWDTAKVIYVQWSGWQSISWPLVPQAPIAESRADPAGRLERSVTTDRVDLGSLGEHTALKLAWLWLPSSGRKNGHAVWFAKDFPVPIKMELLAGNLRHIYTLRSFAPGEEPF